MERIVDSTQTHGADTCKNGAFAALYYAHFMNIAALRCVILRVEAAHYAALRLGQRAAEEGLAGILEQAVVFHYHCRNDNIGGVSADIAVAVSGSCKRALVIDGGLNGELIPCLELICPFAAHLYYFAAELVTDYYRILCNIIGDALMVGALYAGLI